MADSLFDILSQKDFTEPPELVAIKKYVREHFKVDVELVLRDREIIMNVPSASLATTLRFHMRKMREAANTDKRIVLRIV